MSWAEMKAELDLELEPIGEFPGRQRTAEERERANFSATLKDTLKLLKLELGVLRARDLVCSIDIRASDLRGDGLPSPSAVALSPAIVLMFESKYGFLKIGFDRFKRWEHNLRAIALHLQHLREAGVYGVGSNGEAYRGWSAVAPPPRPRKKKSPQSAPNPSPSATSKEREAAEFLAKHGGKTPNEILADAEAFGTAYRMASASLHPDRGGTHEDFVRLQRAVDLLKVRFP